MIKPEAGKKYDDFQLSYALDLLHGKMTVASANAPAPAEGCANARKLDPPPPCVRSTRQQAEVISASEALCEPVAPSSLERKLKSGRGSGR